MATGDFLTLEETANTLGVSVRHARRLADSGAILKVARGVIDRRSVDAYAHSKRQGRTRAWAEATAWGAISLLSGQEADWLGATQRSRLRQALRTISEVDELLTRLRDRARVHTYEAHRAALPRLRDRVTSSDLELLGISTTGSDAIDGYLAAADLDDVVRALGLREAIDGEVVLRVTGSERAMELVNTTTVAALDAATSTDPRLRGVGQRALADLLEAHR